MASQASKEGDFKFQTNIIHINQGYVESSLGQPKKPIPSKQVQTSGFSCFVPKPLPLSSSSPLIVFLNPKSGGNQGAKLMQK